MLGTPYQVFVQPRGLTVPQDAEGEVERVESLPPRAGSRQERYTASPAPCQRFLYVEHGQRLKRPTRFGGLRRGEMPEAGLGALEGIIRLHIAHDRQDGVVGHVVAPEKGMDILQGGCVQVFHRADRGVAVRMIGGKVSALSSSITSPYGTLS